MISMGLRFGEHDIWSGCGILVLFYDFSSENTPDMEAVQNIHAQN